jgi:disulfide bond formation protein DsbB
MYRLNLGKGGITAMAIRKKTFIRSVVVGSILLMALMLSVSVALAHTFLSDDPSQVGAISCVFTDTDGCSDDEFTCLHPDGCTRVWKETHFTCAAGDNGWVLLSVACPADTEAAAPAVFLSDVCEPNNGFSGDGWQTWNTSEPGATLYYAASNDGPWMMLDINGPAWILSEADLNAMAAYAGVATYGELWFKANDDGYPANVGNEISNRAARMDEICGS